MDIRYVSPWPASPDIQCPLSCPITSICTNETLQKSEKATIGELWVNQFIKCHHELKSKYTHLYDYQYAKCEDPELIKGWFNCVQKTI